MSFLSTKGNPIRDDVVLSGDIECDRSLPTTALLVLTLPDCTCVNLPMSSTVELLVVVRVADRARDMLCLRSKARRATAVVGRFPASTVLQVLEVRLSTLTVPTDRSLATLKALRSVTLARPTPYRLLLMSFKLILDDTACFASLPSMVDSPRTL